MTNSARPRVLGLGRPRSKWFTNVSLWANTGLLPIEFLKCVSSGEMARRIETETDIAAVMFDSSMNGSDDSFLRHCDEFGIATIAIGPTQSSAIHRFDEQGLNIENCRELFSHMATPALRLPTVSNASTTTEPGRTLAFIGTGNVGASVLACATSQQLHDLNQGNVLLIDAKRRGDLGMFHDAPDVVPNLEELLIGLQASPGFDVIDQCSFGVANRNYRLVLPLCRPHQWTAVTGAQISTLLSEVRSTTEWTVFDLDSDSEGHSECGSWDVEERNGFTRSIVKTADAVVIVGEGGLKGLHALARLVREIVAFGVEPSRLVTVLNKSTKNPVDRLTQSKTLAGLVDAEINAPIFVPKTNIETQLRDVTRLPESLGKTIASAAARLPSANTETLLLKPEQIRPGFLNGTRRSA